MNLPSKKTVVALVIVSGFLLLVVHLVTAPVRSSKADRSADRSADPSADPSASQPSTVDNPVNSQADAAKTKELMNDVLAKQKAATAACAAVPKAGIPWMIAAKETLCLTANQALVQAQMAAGLTEWPTEILQRNPNGSTNSKSSLATGTNGRWID